MRRKPRVDYRWIGAVKLPLGGRPVMDNGIALRIPLNEVIVRGEWPVLDDLMAGARHDRRKQKRVLVAMKVVVDLLPMLIQQNCEIESVPGALLVDRDHTEAQRCGSGAAQDRECPESDCPLANQ